MPESYQLAQRVVDRALLSRAVDERLLLLFAEGRLAGTVHTCIGQEFSGAALADWLRDDDVVFSGHRCHGHLMSLHPEAADALIAELMGRESGLCGGLGGSQHLHIGRFFSSGIQGGSVGIAAGAAFAARGLDPGATDGPIGVSWIGDGTLGEGAVYEAMNLASLWRAPLLIVLEDNGVAQSTPKAQGVAGDIGARALAFGLATFRGATAQWEALVQTAQDAVSHVRGGQGPALLLIDTFRLRAHSKGDDPRPRAEIEAFERRDPLTRLLDEDAQARDAYDAARARVERAVDLAETQARPSPPTRPQAAAPVRFSRATTPVGRMVGRANLALHDAMARDAGVVMIGEDLEDPYGGAFKVSAGLSSAFPGRVRNTPISEAGIVAFATGMALSGCRAIVEIMFGDFVGLAFDQIVNHASKFSEMYQLSEPLNLIIRAPMGGGRGYGPTHSQSLEKHFLGVPGLRVVAVNNILDPYSIYMHLLTSDAGVTLVIENKLLYGMQAAVVPDGWSVMTSDEALPTAWLAANAPEVDVTLLTYGGGGDLCARALVPLFDDHDVVAQVLCLSEISPCDIRAYAHVLSAATAIVIVEEGQGFGGFGAESAAQIAAAFPALAGRVARVSSEATVIPASIDLERELLPNLRRVLQAVVEVLA